MKRQIPGLHTGQQATARHLEGLFLVRIDTASYRWHPQKPFLILRFVILEPEPFATHSFSGRLYCSAVSYTHLDVYKRQPYKAVYSRSKGKE